MRRTLTEESILFASVIKWIALASCTGVVVGLAATAFLKSLSWATDAADGWSHTYLFLPLAFLVSSLLTTYLAPDAAGHGTEKVIEAIHRRASVIPLGVVPVKLFATVLTLSIGGSAGKEGPCAQIGAGLSSFLAKILRFDETDRKKLVICGISAGFATVFGTPIAGAIFGVEVLYVGGVLYEVLLPSFIAGVTAYQVSSAFGIPYFHEAPSLIPTINETLLLKVILAGILFGLVAVLLIRGMQTAHALFARLAVWPPVRGLIGGGMLVVLAWVFGREFLGLGLPTISACLRGEEVAWYTPFVKIVCTAITLSCGGSGGILTPVFFVGTTTGSVLADWLHVDAGMLSAIGFVSLLAGATNTPIAASIMALEVFGPAIGPYAAVACIVSYLMTGHRSVYPSQILMIRKSASLHTETGREIHQARPSYTHRSHTIAAFLLTLWQKLATRWKKRS